MKVSIILPVYNNQNDVINAINSIIKQTFQNWELIIVDDCSTDNTIKIVNDYIKKYNRQNRRQNRKKIRLIRNKSNMGCYCSMNEGLNIAKGEYITRIDSDDEFDKNKLENQVNILDKYPNIIAVKTFMKRGNMKRWGEITLMYRKRIIDEIGYYDSVRFGADSEFISRLIKKYGIESIYKLKKILYFAKERENSLTRSETTGVKEFSTHGGIVRKCYLRMYKRWQNNTKNLFMHYPLVNRPFPVNKLMM